MFSCNLPPALLAEWPGSFTSYCGNTGVGTDAEVSTPSHLNEVCSVRLRSLFHHLLQAYRSPQGHGYICNRVYCIHVSGHDPLTFSFRFLFLFDWVGVLWPQLSKVLKLVRWAGSVPFPPVSLQRQVVCCFGRCSCVHLRGEPTLFPGWCK